jgi:hypothetical protein
MAVAGIGRLLVSVMEQEMDKAGGHADSTCWNDGSQHCCVYGLIIGSKGMSVSIDPIKLA